MRAWAARPAAQQQMQRAHVGAIEGAHGASDEARARRGRRRSSQHGAHMWGELVARHRAVSVTNRHEPSQVRRRRRVLRHWRRLALADGVPEHLQGRLLIGGQERPVSQEELEDGDAQAPDLGVTTGASEDVVGLEVEVRDAARVEVRQPCEAPRDDLDERGLLEGASDAGEGAVVHELEEAYGLVGVDAEKGMAAHKVGRAGCAAEHLVVVLPGVAEYEQCGHDSAVGIWVWKPGLKNPTWLHIGRPLPDIAYTGLAPHQPGAQQLLPVSTSYMRRRGMGMVPAVVVAVLALAAVASTASASPAEGIQPLSKIAIHKATVNLHGSAYVRATPALLGDQDEDTVWVTVKFGSEKPSTDDWIAVFSPADFVSGSCPNPQRYPDEPLLCTAPIKYQYANYSANYVDWGKGSIRFQLINQRADFSFALFTGGLENPTLVAVSKRAAFKNPKAPVFPRLAQGKTHDEMTVTWTSGYDIGEAYPFVEWGMVASGVAGGSPARSPAGTLTFNRGSMCGEPARTVGWRDPGFIHTAFMRDLWPNKEYFYKIGHELLDETVVWGKSYTFKAPPTPGQNSLQRIIVFGDMGKAERDGSNEFANYQPGSLNTTDRLVEDLDNYDMVFHIGDMPYANGYLPQWDQFTAQVAPISAKRPYMIASGNHERDWPDTGGFFDVKDSGGECGVPAETMYYYPAENRANFWYKVDYGLFRFCIADSEHDWREGTPQYRFIEECLSTVDRKHQPWLVFAAHRVLGYSSNTWYAEQGSFEEPEGRESLQKLWQRYRVDLAYFGHVHNYERTCPLYQSQCVGGGGGERRRSHSHYSGTVNGTIFVVAGGGGSHLSDYTTAIPKWSVFRDKDYGFTKLTAFNHSSLLFEYKKSSDGKVYDSFTIHRDYRDVLRCVHDSCFPTTLAT